MIDSINASDGALSVMSMSNDADTYVFVAGTRGALEVLTESYIELEVYSLPMSRNCALGLTVRFL